MAPLTLQEIRRAVGGKSVAPLPASAPEACAVVIDDRKVVPGSVFIAIRGDKHDGHSFLPAAAERGAIAAVVSRPISLQRPGVHQIVVDDTRIALGKLARHVRQKHLKGRVVAVAGSNGKTSTKLLIEAGLRSLKGTVSEKSFNNEIGVPLTIFKADPKDAFVVLEMGTNHKGEIRRLAMMALPDVAVITNCGAEHLEGLDDLIGVRRENASVVEGLRADGTLVVHGDDPALLEAIASYKGRVIRFGLNPSNDLFATGVQCDESGVRFNLNASRREVFVPLLGRHNAVNALAAIAVGRHLRVPEEQVIEGLATARGPEMRMQLRRAGGVTIVNDAYNANPNSMRAALETLRDLPAPGRRFAVLGDMLELGRATEKYHHEVGELAASCGLDVLACVGTHAAHIATAARRAGMKPEQVHHFPDARAAAAALPRWVRDGDLLLTKASRGIRLEAVAEAVAQAFGSGAFGASRRAAS